MDLLTEDYVRDEEDGDGDVVVCAAHVKTGFKTLNLRIPFKRLATGIATSNQEHQPAQEGVARTDVGPVDDGKQIQNGQGRYQPRVDLLTVRPVAPRHSRQGCPTFRYTIFSRSGLKVERKCSSSSLRPVVDPISRSTFSTFWISSLELALCRPVIFVTHKSSPSVVPIEA